MNTIESQPMGMMDRLKAAGNVVVSGKLPNPLSEPPKDKSRAALVEELTTWARDEREFWKPIHERMQQEQRFAAGDQWGKDYKSSNGGDGKPYIGDIVQQLVNRVVAAIYAKNPTPDAQRLEKRMFSIWDESQESLRGAQAILANPAQLASTGAAPESIGIIIEGAKSLVQDYEQGMAEKKMMEKLAETASLLIKHRWKTHKPNFTVMMKQAVTHAVVSRVGFIQVSYQRDMEQTPNEDSGVGLPEQMASIQQKMQELQNSDDKDNTPLREELRLLMEGVQRQISNAPGGKVTFEGTVYQLLAPTSVIIDRKCTCMWEFMGARRVARQTLMDVAAAEKRFGVSLKDCGAIMYGEDGTENKQADGRSDLGDGKATVKQKVCIWHIEDKDAQLCYVVCDGVKDFLPKMAGESNEPYEPTPALERFWTIVPITLNAQVVERNEPEFDVTIYPRSHVRLQMPMQEDINRAGEGLREHRVANRPGMVGVKSKFTEPDLAKLAGPRQAHDVDLLENLQPGEKITDFLQPRPTTPIDPKLYDPSPSLQAAMLATGLQPANLGAQAGDEKATGQAIAEGARISADQSNVAGVDFALSVLAQCTWEMEIQETSTQTVKVICGRGALWTNLRRDEVRAEIHLEVEAGSSGRPNEALAAQKFKEVAPLAVPWMQALGIPLDVLVKEAFRILGIKIDVDALMAKAQWQQPAPMGQMGPTGPMPGGQPGVPPGGAAPNVAQGGVPGAPPIPPQQRQQVAASAMQ